MGRKCVIISGGRYSPIENSEEDAFIIACDRGYEYAKRDGIEPNLIIGDFDSYEGSLPNETEVIKLQCEKDDTDTMVAIKYAIDKGFDEIVLCCALGGRLDHLYANIQNAVYAVKHNIKVKITEAENKIYFLQNESMVIEKKECFSLSVFAVTEQCTGVCIKGVKYELDNAVLKNDFPLGISNEWVSDAAEISVENGILMIILSKIK